MNISHAQTWGNIEALIYKLLHLGHCVRSRSTGGLQKFRNAPGQLGIQCLPFLRGSPRPQWLLISLPQLCNKTFSYTPSQRRRHQRGSRLESAPRLARHGPSLRVSIPLSCFLGCSPGPSSKCCSVLSDFLVSSGSLPSPDKAYVRRFIS